MGRGCCLFVQATWSSLASLGVPLLFVCGWLSVAAGVSSPASAGGRRVHLLFCVWTSGKSRDRVQVVTQLRRRLQDMVR